MIESIWDLCVSSDEQDGARRSTGTFNVHSSGSDGCLKNVIGCHRAATCRSGRDMVNSELLEALEFADCSQDEMLECRVNERERGLRAISTHDSSDLGP